MAILRCHFCRVEKVVARVQSTGSIVLTEAALETRTIDGAEAVHWESVGKIAHKQTVAVVGDAVLWILVVVVSAVLIWMAVACVHAHLTIQRKVIGL